MPGVGHQDNLFDAYGLQHLEGVGRTFLGVVCLALKPLHVHTKGLLGHPFAHLCFAFEIGLCTPTFAARDQQRDQRFAVQLHAVAKSVQGWALELHHPIGQVHLHPAAQDHDGAGFRFKQLGHAHHRVLLQQMVIEPNRHMGA